MYGKAPQIRTELAQIPNPMGNETAAGVAEVQRAVPQEFTESLDRLAVTVPEIQAKREVIERGGKQLIDELGISPELFEDDTRSLFFSALAERTAGLEDSKKGLSVDAYTDEKGFVFDAAMMLARDKSQYFDEMKGLIDAEDTKTGAEETRVLDSFTNRQVTADLQKAINEGGLLDAVKERMHITAGNEDPYEIHVLNITSDIAISGMRPDAAEDRPEFLQYKEGLEKKTEAFKQAMGIEGVPLAWVKIIDGKRHLNMPLPVAEKILYAEPERSNSYSDADRDKDIATLGHEYTHSQGGLGVDGKLFYGLLAEERRAEHKAGNKMGYQDAKGFTDIDMMLINGFRVTDMIEASAKGGDMKQFYSELTNKLGLQGALEFALVVPKAYLSDTRTLQKGANQYLGGINGVLERQYDRLTPERKERVEQIINTWAEGQVKNDKIDNWLSMRKGMHGLGFVTDKLAEALAHARLSAGNL